MVILTVNSSNILMAVGTPQHFSFPSQIWHSPAPISGPHIRWLAGRMLLSATPPRTISLPGHTRPDWPISRIVCDLFHFLSLKPDTSEGMTGLGHCARTHIQYCILGWPAQASAWVILIQVYIVGDSYMHLYAKTVLSFGELVYLVSDVITIKYIMVYNTHYIRC